MHTATDEILPGLKYKRIGLGLINHIGELITKKATNFAENQIEDIAQELEHTEKSTLPEVVSKKLAKVKRIGAGRRRVKRRGKKRRTTTKKVHKKYKLIKKGRRSRKVAKKRKSSKKKCFKGNTIFS